MRWPALAALTSIPGRPLEAVLRALRPQVDQLHVLLDRRYGTVPAYCRTLCDVAQLDERDLGSAGKFAWTRAWDGLYLCCDDDILYPEGYVARMRAEVGRWGEKAAVSCWGRTYPPRPRGFRDWWGEGSYRADVPAGRWVNHLGTGALAFAAALDVPDHFPMHNEDEIGFNLWAQRQHVPCWLITRPENWPPRIPLGKDAPTLFKQAKARGFAARDAGLAATAWQVFTL